MLLLAMKGMEHIAYSPLRTLKLWMDNLTSYFRNYFKPRIFLTQKFYKRIITAQGQHYLWHLRTMAYVYLLAKMIIIPT